MAETAHAGRGTGPGATGGTQGGGGAQGGGAQEKAQQAMGDAKEQVKEQAGQAKEQARGRVSSEVDRRSTDAGERVKTQADDLRSVGQQLREQGKEGPAKVADQVAQRAERVGGYLQQSDGDRILNDIEDLARRNPWALAAGGVVLGIAASRFIKASSAERSSRRATMGPTYGTPRTGTTPALPAPTGGGYSGTGVGGAGTGLGTDPLPPTTGVGDAFGTPGTPGTPVTPSTPGVGREDPLRPGGGR